MVEGKKQAHWPKKQFNDAILTISKPSILPASVCLFMQTGLGLGFQWWKQKKQAHRTKKLFMAAILTIRNVALLSSWRSHSSF
jgi:hypothetical protein